MALERWSPGRTVALAGCLLLAWFFWDSAALWPLKLLAVMVHETGHAVATWGVGGQVERITLSHDESGACLSRLPAGLWRQVLVYSAGYLGSAVAGAALLVATFRLRMRRVMLALFCAWLALMGVLYAGDAFTLFFCLGTALLLGLGARLLPDAAVEALDTFLAAFIALYAAFDLRSDLWDGRVRVRSDAALLSDLTWVPAFVWAGLWSLLALGLLCFSGYHALRGRDLTKPGARI